MFGRRRLAREEYALMGSNPVWQLSDAVNLLTMFELEVSGAFGRSKELVAFTLEVQVLLAPKYDGEEFGSVLTVSDQNGSSSTEYSIVNTIPVFDVKFSEADVPDVTELITAYSKLYSKWNTTLLKTLWGDDFISGNIPRRDIVSLNLPEGAGKTVDDTRSFVKDELFRYLVTSVGEKTIDINLDMLNDFMDGKGTAPARSVKVVEVEIPPSSYLKKIGATKHDPDKPKHKALEDFLLDDLSGGCTCTKRQACDRIFKDKYRGDKDCLKSETGYKTLMFERTVSKVLQGIEKKEMTGINRHENTTGFSMSKVPPCIKHPTK